MAGIPGGCPIHINFNGVPHSEASNLVAAPAIRPPSKDQIQDAVDIPGLRDVAVREYSAWHETNVADDNLKAQFRQARDVALANGLDLQLIYEDQDPAFFVGQGIMVGIARQFVRDIMKWVRYVSSV